MKIQKSHFAIIALCFWVFILVNLTPLVLLGFKQNNVNLDTKTPHNNEQVFFNLEEMSPPQGPFYEVFFEGWAFVETSNNSDNKRVELILEGNSSIYNVPAHVLDRTDVMNVFKDSKVKSFNQGVTGRFSILNLKDDIYRVKFLVIENDQNSGITPVIKKFRKLGNQFYEETAKELSSDYGKDISKTQVNVKYHIDQCRMDGNDFVIQGWAFKPDTEYPVGDIVLELFSAAWEENRYFSTTIVTRSDVANHFKNQEYLSSGFKLVVGEASSFQLPLNVRLILDGHPVSGPIFECEDE